MKNILLAAGICFISTLGAFAQSECPVDKVCISPAAAQKALADGDKVIALEAEGKAKDAAIADLRDLLNKSRIEFASVSGEATALRQNAVQDRAIIDLLLKSVRKKCMPFSVCF